MKFLGQLLAVLGSVMAVSPIAQGAQIIFIDSEQGLVVVDNGTAHGWEEDRRVCFVGPEGPREVCGSVQAVRKLKSGVRIDQGAASTLAKGDWVVGEGWSANYARPETYCPANSASQQDQQGNECPEVAPAPEPEPMAIPANQRITLFGSYAYLVPTAHSKVAYLPRNAVTETRASNWLATGDPETTTAGLGGQIVTDISRTFGLAFGMRSEDPVISQVKTEFSNDPADGIAQSRVSVRSYSFWIDGLYQHSIGTWLALFAGAGVDFSKSLLHFRSNQTNGSDEIISIIGRAQSELNILALRVPLGMILKFGKFSLEFGAPLMVPLLSYGEESESDTPSVSGVTLTAEDNLIETLDHSVTSFAGYGYVGIGWLL